LFYCCADEVEVVDFAAEFDVGVVADFFQSGLFDKTFAESEVENLSEGWRICGAIGEFGDVNGFCKVVIYAASFEFIRHGASQQQGHSQCCDEKFVP